MIFTPDKTTASDKEVLEQAIKEAAGNLVWPMLTHTNYQEWSTLVQCNLEGMYLWDAIEFDKVEWHRDWLALGALIRGVPSEMHSLLLTKSSAKEVWEVMKMVRLDAERVKEMNTQKLLAEFELISFKGGESIDDFAI